jgi:hypoxanthine phosphoribosyltransferase
MSSRPELFAPLSAEAKQVLREAELLYSAQQVEAALDRMAAEITARLAGRNPVVLCVMVGALIPCAKLLERLDFLLQVDYIHATRYGDKTQGGTLHWLARPRIALEHRVVLVIDDILDEGYTLAAILDDCRQAGASEVLTAVLVEKQHGRRYGVRADFCELSVEDRYVFGYGMDYKGYFRNLTGIYAVKEHA